MLHSGGDEAPWIPAGLAGSVVMLVAIAAREVVMRRAWTRYLLERDRRDQHLSGESGGARTVSRSSDTYSTAFRLLQKQSAEADRPEALPEAHLEAYLSCREYLESTDEALRSAKVANGNRAAVRAGQERVRALQRHHLLHWASGAARTLTHEAQRRARLSDKIETAMRALDVIDSALKVYPEEEELHESGGAVREFIASAKVAHWVELAERAAFKGHYTRAIDRYRDALFYLSRESLSEERRAELAERIGREIEMLRARLKTRKLTIDPAPAPSSQHSETGGSEK
jgi:hypothetical protein